jgi:ferredoxin
MSRQTALARLAAAYARHQVRHRFERARPQLEDLLRTYEPEHLVPLTQGERDALPAISGCILCGACALAAGRYGSVRLPDLAAGHLRSWDLLPAAASDLDGERPDLAAAAAACPVGVPLEEVARMAARLSGREA